MHTSVTSNLKEIHTDVNISSTLSVRRPRGFFDAQHEFCVPSLLSTELSHCPASDPLLRVFQCTPGHRLICSPNRSNLAPKSPRRAGARVEKKSLAKLIFRTLNSFSSQPVRRSSAVGAHHVPVLELCGVFTYPWYQRMRRANLCPQIRLRAALQGSDEALHNVQAALSMMVALLLSFLRVLDDGDATFSPQPPNLLGKSENGSLSHFKVAV